MNTAATLLVENLGRTTLALAVAGIVAIAVLRLVRSQWPTAHRLAWLLVLLVGWSFVRLPVTVPWYEAEPAAPAVVELAPADVIAGNVTAADAVAADLIATEPPVIDLAQSAPSPAASLAVDSSIPPLTSAASPSLPPQPAIVPAVQQTLPEHARHDAIDWPTVVVAAWILGMSLCAAAWLVGYLRFVRLLHERQPADDDSCTVWRELLAAAGVRQSIPLSVSHQFGPMLCCLPRGYELVVPGELWSELDAAGRRAILRHELAHYQRGDVWKSLAARVLALPHWFNPVAWLAVRRFEEAAEWACDRAAIADEPATEYAKLLVHLGQTPHALGYGSSAHGRTLAARVRRVLAGEEAKDSTLKKVSLLLIGLAIVGVSVVQFELVAQQPNESKPTATDVESAKVAEDSGNDDQQPTDDVVPGKAPEEVPESNPETPQQRMIDEAKRAFEAHQAAYEAQTITLPPVYDWSLRWMQALESVARNQADRIAAARDHVERMAGLQKRIELLYNVGNQGGEAKDHAAANFYLAEAEKHLAEVGAQAAASDNRTPPVESVNAAAQIVELLARLAELQGLRQQAQNDLKAAQTAVEQAQAAHKSGTMTTAQLNDAVANQLKRDFQLKNLIERQDLYERMLKLAKTAITQPQPARETTVRYDDLLGGGTAGQSFDRELETVDLEIKLTELRGELEQTAIQIKTAESRLAGYRRILTQQSNALSQAELTKAEGEVERLKIQRATVEQQIKLHERKLALLKRQPQPASRQARSGTGELWIQTPPTLLYAGKDFHQWLKILREDLDPTSRIEAVRALATFANHGHGPEAAEAIVEMFKDYKIIPYDGGTLGTLRSIVSQVFARFNDGGVPPIPQDDAMPVVIKALQSDHAKQRLFAVVVLQNLTNAETATPLLAERLKDSDSDVRRQAAMYLVTKAPETPGLLDVMRQWLLPAEGQQQSQMGLSAVAQAPKSMQLELAPDAVKLLDREVGGGLQDYPGNASTLLRNLGADAIPALEEGLKSDNKTVREKSRDLLDYLRSQATEERRGIEVNK